MKQATDMNFEAVLFDCDGVLVDSEPIVNRVLFGMLQDLGWSTTALTREAVDHFFTGRTIRDVMLAWAQEQGNHLPADWMDRFLAQRNAALVAELQAIPGIHAAVEALFADLLAEGDEFIQEGVEEDFGELGFGADGEDVEDG